VPSKKDSVIEIDGNYIQTFRYRGKQGAGYCDFNKKSKRRYVLFQSFKNLRIIGFDVVNDIQMTDKKDRTLLLSAEKHNRLPGITAGA